VRQRLARALQVVLGAALILFGVTKMYSGHQPVYMLAWPTYYLIAFLEVVFGVLFLAGRLVRAACWFVLVLTVGGVCLGLVHSGRSCGCLGMWIELRPRAHVVVAAALGMLSTLALLVTRADWGRAPAQRGQARAG